MKKKIKINGKLSKTEKVRVCNCDLFEEVIRISKVPRREWDGGDDLRYRSDEEIFTSKIFWESLLNNLKWRNPKLKHDRWLMYAKIHFELYITKQNTKDFWIKLLN